MATKPTAPPTAMTSVGSMSAIMLRTLKSISSLRKSAICSRLESRVPVSSPTRIIRIIIGSKRPVAARGTENPSPESIRSFTESRPRRNLRLPDEAATMAKIRLRCSSKE